MSHIVIDVSVTLILFVTGMIWTVFRYGKRDRMGFAVVAVVSPVIAVFSFFSLIFQVITGRVKVGPCPEGLPEAERLVDLERQRLFGGELRKPTFALNWQRAYEIELQREAEGVKRIAHRVFVNA